jgi:hypothetical protein
MLAVDDQSKITSWNERELDGTGVSHEEFEAVVPGLLIADVNPSDVAITADVPAQVIALVRGEGENNTRKSGRSGSPRPFTRTGTVSFAKVSVATEDQDAQRQDMKASESRQQQTTKAAAQTSVQQAKVPDATEQLMEEASTAPSGSAVNGTCSPLHAADASPRQVGMRFLASATTEPTEAAVDLYDKKKTNGSSAVVEKTLPDATVAGDFSSSMFDAEAAPRANATLTNETVSELSDRSVSPQREGSRRSSRREASAKRKAKKPSSTRSSRSVRPDEAAPAAGSEVPSSRPSLKHQESHAEFL